MSHISGNTILIAGGHDGRRKCGDWYKVDVRTQTVDKMQENDEFRFDCQGNQCKIIDEDNLVALVVDKKWDVHMIKFTISQRSLKTIENFGRP